MKSAAIVIYTLLFCVFSHAQAQVEEHDSQEIAAIVSELVGDMVSIPAGSFYMGDLDSEWYTYEEPVNHVMDVSLRFVSQITSIPDVEAPLRRVTSKIPIYGWPVHRVTVPAFKLGKHEVTVGQFRSFIMATGYRTDAERNAGGEEGCLRMLNADYIELDVTPGGSWHNPGYAIADNQPVVCVSWHDARAFIYWLNGKTGSNYRLPSDAEWEYAARAGSTTTYSWGDYIGNNLANCDYYCGDRWDYTSPVGSFPANAWGLHDMHGNVYEWVQDCWNYSYEGAPTDGSAWESGDCGERVVRGGSWMDGEIELRSSLRRRYVSRYRFNFIGFRLAQDE